MLSAASCISPIVLPLDGGGLRWGCSPSPLSPPAKGGDGGREKESPHQTGFGDEGLLSRA